MDFFNLLAEIPSDWERKVFGVHISTTLTHCGVQGWLTESISSLLLDDSDPNPKVDHRGVGERTTEMEGVGWGTECEGRLKEVRKARQGQKKGAGPGCTVVSLKPTCCDINPMSLSYVALFGNRVVEGFN